MDRTELENADTIPPGPDHEQVPFADAPCDATGCTTPWKERVEWTTEAGVVVRFACARHSYLYLMSARERLPH